MQAASTSFAARLPNPRLPAAGASGLLAGLQATAKSAQLISGVKPLPRALATFAIELIALLPEAVRDLLARFVGALAYALGIRRGVTLDNLRQAFPDLSEAERRKIARGAYRNMARAAVEGLASHRIPAEVIRARTTIENEALLDEALAKGKGVLFATAHFGSWELLGEALAIRGLPLHAVVRPLKGAVNSVLMERREQAGMRLIPARGAVPGSIKALRQNQVVAVLFDQVLPSRRAVQVPFFGRPAYTSPGLSYAAIRSGASVLLAIPTRAGKGLRLVLSGPFDPPATGDLEADVLAHTARLTAALEQVIRGQPDQWLWLHRRWKVPPKE